MSEPITSPLLIEAATYADGGVASSDSDSAKSKSTEIGSVDLHVVAKVDYVGESSAPFLKDVARKLVILFGLLRVRSTWHSGLIHRR